MENRPAPSPRTYAIGDVHGCDRKLGRLFKLCVEHSEDRPCQFIFLGDYIDRGPDSRAVIEWLMSAQAMIPQQLLCLRGNHEDLLAKAVRGTEDDEDQWLMNGGAKTLASYGLGRSRDIPEAHRKWMRDLPLLFRDERRLYVHAGIVPGVPLQQQPRDALLDRRKVGQGAAEPTLIDEVRAGAFRLFLHHVLRLFLGADEKNDFLFTRHLADGVVGLA